MDNDLMLRVTYRDQHGSTYTDILGAKEICITRQWLDKVINVERLGPQPVTLNNKEAQDYLQNLSNNNNTTH